MGWAADEFDGVDLGDKRLDSRLVKLFDSFSEAPESPINQACEDWAETKAAYRFFQNENVDVVPIMAAHRGKTLSRAAEHSTILALQDTSYFVYTNHPKTRGLGEISMKKGTNIDKIYSRGLVMHTCLAVTTQGLPLGLLDQKIFARKLRPEHKRRGMGGKPIHDDLPVEEKESFRWIEALDVTPTTSARTQVVTVCDRECDFYDFFKAADKNGSSVLVRAAQNRTINRGSRYAEKNIEKLWDHIASQPDVGSYAVEVAAVKQTKHNKGRTARTAQMGIKFGEFKMNPPRNNPKHKTEILPDIQLFAIHAMEINPPVMTTYSEDLTNKEPFYIGGKHDLADSQIDIFLQKQDTGETFSFVSKTDQKGDWFYISEEPIHAGEYRVWTQARVDALLSPTSPAIIVSVIPVTLRLGSSILTKETLYLFAVLVLLALFIAVTLYGLHHLREAKKKEKAIEREVMEAQQSIKLGFAILKRDIQAQIHASTKKGMSDSIRTEELGMEQKLLEDLAFVESHIGQEILDIKEEIDE